MKEIKQRMVASTQHIVHNRNHSENVQCRMLFTATQSDKYAQQLYFQTQFTFYSNSFDLVCTFFLLNSLFVTTQPKPAQLSSVQWSLACVRIAHHQNGNHSLSVVRQFLCRKSWSRGTEKIARTFTALNHVRQ